jgi:hypothetical protein
MRVRLVLFVKGGTTDKLKPARHCPPKWLKLELVHVIQTTLAHAL